MSDLSYISALDRFSIAANETADGISKVIDVINGAYDDLILYQRSYEQWENKSFDIRAKEIEKQAALGTISVAEQAAMWKELTDIQTYGWQNVWKAEQEYRRLLYLDSKNWIDEMKRKGELSPTEIAEAWQRIYDNFESADIKHEAAVNIREILLNDAFDKTAERRLDSDRWMKRQDLYDGGDFARQYDDFSRRIEAEKDLLTEIESGYLNGVKLGAEEQKRLWAETYMYIEDLQDKQYMSAKNLLDQSVKDYVDASNKKLDKEYQLKKSSLEKELSEVDKYYDRILKRRKDAEYESELNDLYRLEKYYRNAVTKEGQDKYADILKKINNIENQKYESELEEERNYEKNRIKEKMSDAEQEYKTAKERISEISDEMLGLTSSVANQGTQTAIQLGTVLNSITSSVSGNVENIFKNSEQALAGYVKSISDMIGSLGGVTNNSRNDYSLTFNDYGAKNINSKYSAKDYADWMMENFGISLRTWGVK